MGDFRVDLPTLNLKSLRRVAGKSREEEKTRRRSGQTPPDPSSRGRRQARHGARHTDLPRANVGTADDAKAPCALSRRVAGNKEIVQQKYSVRDVDGSVAIDLEKRNVRGRLNG